MSVTFSPAVRLDIPHTLTCMCGEWTQGVQYDSHADAWEMSKSVTSGCSDEYCDDTYVYPVSIVPEPEVQMSNGNAVTILDVLGIKVGEDFSDRCSGSISVEDMKGRILMAQAINPTDEGSATIAVGNVVDCGRPEGYTDGKLFSLLEVVEFAEANNVDIVWG